MGSFLSILVVPLLYRSMAPAEPNHFGAGNMATQGYRFLLLQDVTDQVHHMLKMVPISLSGRWLFLKELTSMALYLPMKIPMANISVTLFQPLHIYVGGATHFNHLKYNKTLRVRIRVSISLMAVSDVLPGTLGVSLGRFLLRKKSGS